MSRDGQLGTQSSIAKPHVGNLVCRFVWTCLLYFLKTEATWCFILSFSKEIGKEVRLENEFTMSEWLQVLTVFKTAGRKKSLLITESNHDILITETPSHGPNIVVVWHGHFCGHYNFDSLGRSLLTHGSLLPPMYRDSRILRDLSQNTRNQSGISRYCMQYLLLLELHSSEGCYCNVCVLPFLWHGSYFS